MAWKPGPSRLIFWGTLEVRHQSLIVTVHLIVIYYHLISVSTRVDSCVRGTRTSMNFGHFAGLCVAMPFVEAGFFGRERERERIFNRIPSRSPPGKLPLLTTTDTTGIHCVVNEILQVLITNNDWEYTRRTFQQQSFLSIEHYA